MFDVKEFTLTNENYSALIVPVGRTHYIFKQNYNHSAKKWIVDIFDADYVLIASTAAYLQGCDLFRWVRGVDSSAYIKHVTGRAIDPTRHSLSDFTLSIYAKTV